MYMEKFNEIIAAFFISLGLYYLSKISKGFTNEKTFLLMFLCYILGSMVLLFIADKLFFPNRQLISKEGGAQLFDLIKQLLLILFGFYFAKTTQNK